MATLIGQNVTVDVKGQTLTLTIKLDAQGEPSRTGKTTVIASTRGNAVLEGTGGAVLGLNLYRKR